MNSYTSFDDLKKEKKNVCNGITKEKKTVRIIKLTVCSSESESEIMCFVLLRYKMVIKKKRHTTNSLHIDIYYMAKIESKIHFDMLAVHLLYEKHLKFSRPGSKKKSTDFNSFVCFQNISSIFFLATFTFGNIAAFIHHWLTHTSSIFGSKTKL